MKTEKIDFSLIVPCYNEEEAIPVFYKELSKSLPLIQKIVPVCEIIFVDDGSSDKTLSLIKSLTKRDKSISYIGFSRNFGKEAAMYAGMYKARGAYIAIMDVDLQDPLSLLIEMLSTITESEEYDCCGCRRIDRKGEPFIKSLFSRLFYKVMAFFTDIQLVSGARDFRVMKRTMVDAILSLTEVNRFSKGIFQWVGFKTKWFEYRNVERCAGTTKWSFGKLFLYSLDGITAFSTKPLAFASISGMISIFVSFILILFIIIRTLIWGDPTRGWPSTICIILFLGGIQLCSIGILGQYISKIFTEVKHRPLYIIKEEH